MRVLVRITTLVLLAWTAVDLTCPDLCASEPIAAEASAPAMTAPGAATGVNAAEASHNDDCFCCARCIDTGVRVPRFDAARGRTEFSEPVRHLATRAATLEHPPRANA